MTEHMKLWDAVSKTDPSHTKKVNQRGGFTAISAHYQIMKATEQFGSLGVGWGYTNSDPILLDGVVTIGVTLWHGDKDNKYGPVWGGADLKDSKGKLDSDAPKKAGTDGLTKALSQLGFNADVFLGRFDDNKYVTEVTAEFAGARAPANESAPRTQPPRPRPEALTGIMKTRAIARTKYGEIVRELHGCGDESTLDAYLATVSAELSQFEMELPEAWNGDGSDVFPGLKREIDAARIRCAGEAMVDRVRAG